MSLISIRVPEEEVVIALIEALKDEDLSVSSHAVHALGAIGPAAISAVPILEEIEAKGGYSANAAEEALRDIRRQAK